MKSTQRGETSARPRCPRRSRSFSVALNPRDHHVFFGAFERDREPKGLADRISERFASMMPAIREATDYGDFRDWPEIEAWAVGIARELSPVPAV